MCFSNIHIIYIYVCMYVMYVVCVCNCEYVRIHMCRVSRAMLSCPELRSRQQVTEMMRGRSLVTLGTRWRVLVVSKCRERDGALCGWVCLQ